MNSVAYFLIFKILLYVKHSPIFALAQASASFWSSTLAQSNMTDMTRTIVALIILSTAPFLTFAKNDSGTIAGKFIDESGEPAAFTTVILLDTDSSMIKVDYTTDLGEFKFSAIQPGKYRLKTSNIEFREYLGDFFELTAGDELTLTTITLSPAVTELQEVEVRAARPLVEIHPDKTVFNVSESINATSSDALEVLRKAPGVVLDNNDNIILRGKSGVIIYIDGKQTYLAGTDLIAMLRNMTADQIESIEIITNPSAKYDAAGSAGIINIKLKRDKNLGFNSTVSAQADLGQKNRYNTGINFNYRDKKSNLYGHYNYHDNEGLSYENYNKRINNFEMDQKSNDTWSHAGHDIRSGLDYFINDKHTVGTVLEGNFSNQGGTSYSRTPITNINMGGLESILVSDGYRNGTTDNLKINLNYQFKTAKGQNLSFDADYGYYSTERQNYLPNAYYNPGETEIIDERNYTDDQQTRIDIRTFKGDYETGLLNGRFSTGFKYSNVTTDNDYKFFFIDGENLVPDVDRTSQFFYTEMVYAAYGSYYGKIGEKTNYNLGLRVERTESDGQLESEKATADDDVVRSYTDFFPSGGISRNFNENNTVSVNYSRRIDRPNYQNLNPFEFKLDELTFRRGNPFLNPQYTHSFQITHSFRQKLNTGVTYSLTQDFFAQILDTAGVNGSLISEQNIADARNISLNTSYNTDITKWWSIFTNGTLYNASYQSTLERDEIDVDVTAFNFYLQNNFLLPKGFRMELSGWYNSPSVWGGTIRMNEMWSMDAGLKKSILDDRCNISMSVQDIFKSQQWSGVSNYNGLEFNAHGGWDSRRFRVKVDFKLGNQNVKKVRNRSTGLEEESKRIG